MRDDFDVAIIGGGPAGSTAATLLARAGRRVVVFEREKFPRFHIGESLLPCSMPVFERLGVRERLDREFMPKVGAEVITPCASRQARFFFRDGFRLEHHRAWQVTRADFDKLLLDHSRDAGAEVHEETTVAGVEFDAEGATLKIEGSGREVRARYVIDASGRHAVLGAKLDLKRRYPSLDKFSVFAHFDGVAREAVEGGTLTRMVRVEDRWFWLIPLSETRTSIGVVVDAAVFRAARQKPEEFFEDSLAAQPAIAEAMCDATRVTPVFATGDYSYWNERLAGDRWLLAGDAAGFIDPIFSTGVFLALVSGESAADAIDAALAWPRRRARLFSGYERRLRRAMRLYLRFVEAWYTPEFAEVITTPNPPFRLNEAINSVLAGNLAGGWAVWWRMQLFYFTLRLQRRWPLCPRIVPDPGACASKKTAPSPS